MIVFRILGRGQSRDPVVPKEKMVSFLRLTHDHLKIVPITATIFYPGLNSPENFKK